MKLCVRFLSVVLAVSLFLSGAAMAEADMFAALKNSFAQVSTADLLMLKSMLEVEIASREDKDKEVTVPAGIYYVGVDIPIGIYTIIGADTVASVKIRDHNGLQILSETLYKDQMLGRTDLAFGYKVEIHGGPVIFSNYKGLGF